MKMMKNKMLSFSACRGLFITVCLCFLMLFSGVFLFYGRSLLREKETALNEWMRVNDSLRIFRNDLNSFLFARETFARDSENISFVNLILVRKKMDAGEDLLRRAFERGGFSSDLRMEASTVLMNLRRANEESAKRLQTFDPEASHSGTMNLLLRDLSVYSGELMRSLRALEDLRDRGSAAILMESEKRFSFLLLALFLFLLLSLGLFFLFALLLERRTSNSLRILSEGTKQLRSGNLNFRFREIVPDEIGEVQYDFNMMVRRLEQQATELRNANADLSARTAALIAANQHKDRFLSNMSHELRTPLNSIIGFSELLEERAEKLPPEKIRSYASRVLTAAEHLLSLITSLLDLAKSGAGTLQCVRTELDVSALFLEMYEMMRPLAEKKSLELRCEISSGIHVMGDARILKQIFLNLFANAIKYTDHGFVRVSFAKSPLKSGCLCLEIEDSGIGIPDEDLPQLFSDFFRSGNAVARSVDGAGIGLALSRRLARLHDGDLRYEKRSAGGSRFFFDFSAQLIAENG